MKEMKRDRISRIERKRDKECEGDKKRLDWKREREGEKIFFLDMRLSQ